MATRNFILEQASEAMATVINNNGASPASTSSISDHAFRDSRSHQSQSQSPATTLPPKATTNSSMASSSSNSVPNLASSQYAYPSARPPLSDTPSSATLNGGTNRGVTVSPGAGPSKEQRVALACLRCRAKRARCSGERPRCKACEAADAECQW